MRYLYFALVFWGLTTSLVLSQIPNGFSYQAVVRGSDGTLLRNQTVAIEATILRDETPIFTQTLSATTNDNGLISIVIGGTDEFSEIDWTIGQLLIRTWIDPEGGNNFIIETTTQLLAVPYAMAAKTAENVPELDLLKERIGRLE